MIKEKNAINPMLTRTEDVMGFLNDVQYTYPKAISLAAGCPDENYFDFEFYHEYIDLYVKYKCNAENKSKKVVTNNIGQYNKTKGVINELVAEYLEKDKNIIAYPEDILLTVGSQEGIAMSVITLCDRENDVILVEDPSFVGMSNFANLAGYNIEPVSVKSEGICLEELEKTLIDFEKKSKNVKLLYVIPDFQNPTGNSMPNERRKQLLELAKKYDFYIIEDNAYGDFSYEKETNQPLKSMDVDKRVIYLNSFSKSVYPSLRLSAMVADQVIFDGLRELKLSDLMAKTKSYLTVNSSVICQALLGGILVKHDCSLKALNKMKINDMKAKRDAVLVALSQFLYGDNSSWSKGISWNHPAGGFFITIRLPFKISKEDVSFCAEKFHVIYTPMSFFYMHDGGEQEIRISYSNISVEVIEPVIKNLCEFFKYKIIEHGK